jgi:hypothetical protein
MATCDFVFSKYGDFCIFLSKNRSIRTIFTGFFLSPQRKKFSPPTPQEKKKTSPNFQKPPQNLKMVSTCGKIISKKIFIQEFGNFSPCLGKQGIL